MILISNDRLAIQKFNLIGEKLKINHTKDNTQSISMDKNHVDNKRLFTILE